MELVEYKINEEKAEACVLVKTNADSDAVWFNEEKFYDEFGSNPADVFGGDLESELDVIYEKRRESRRIENEKSEADKKADFSEKTKQLLESGIVSEDAQRVKHDRFGLGIVVYSDDERIEVLFDDVSVGLKKFVAKFVKLENVNE